MKKLIAILLCAALVLGMISCGGGSGEDIPEGMQIASVAGADYYLFVPTTWNLNTDYGVSGAYFSLVDLTDEHPSLSTVSVERFEQTETLRAEMAAAGLEDSSSARIGWYRAAYCRPALERLAVTGTFADVEQSATVMGDANAVQYRSTAVLSSISCKQHQVIAERGGAFYVMTFLIADTLFEMLSKDVDAIMANFRFSDAPYQPEAQKEIDADGVDVPAGMKLASNDEVAYRFFVPETWVINRSERVFSAYVAEDRSSVSVVPYMPDAETMSIEDYFVHFEEQIKIVADEDGYERVSADPDRTLGGRIAHAYRYRLTVGGKTYEYLQFIAAYKSMIYSVTYTATPENFEGHLEDVERIVSAFAFR